MNKTFVAVMITCDQRRKVRVRTVDSMAATDWYAAVLINYDTSAAARLQERQTANSLAALQAGLRYLEEQRTMKQGVPEGGEFIVFLEDDLEFNRFLEHNLQVWPALDLPKFGMGSLYNPNIRELERNNAQDWFRADPEAVYGSQAYVLSRACAEYIVEHWAEVPGMQDIKMSRLAAQGGWEIYYHSPSLVQHVGEVSVWGGHFHQTADFDALWKSQREKTFTEGNEGNEGGKAKL